MTFPEADPVISFPERARLAFGKGRVVLAAAAGIAGLACCVTSLTIVTLSLPFLKAASTAATGGAEGLSRTLDGDYGGALSVLALATIGFAGVGIVLILLVGRSSMEYRAQWQVARRAHDVLREAIDALPAGVVVYDDEERLLTFNSVAAAVTPSLQRPDSVGRTYEELVRETARQLEAAGKGPQPVEEWLERFRGKQTRRTRQALDGRWFDWSERRTPSGRTVGLRVDVTEIKNHEQALEHARAEYQSLVDSLSDVVFELDLRSGDFTFASAAAADFFGMPPARLIGRPFLDYVAPQYHPLMKDLARRLLKQPSAVDEAEFIMKAAGGTMRHVEVRGRKTVDEHGRETIAGVIRDVEERVQLGDRLAQETARLRSIVESSGALIVLLDRDLRVAMVNSGFTALTGIAATDAVGRPLPEVMTCPFDPGVLVDCRQGPPGRPEPIRFAVRLNDPQGRRRLIALTATPVADTDGRVGSIVLLGFDDTERHDAEQALHDVERFATVGEMAGTMAHEISQPLQVINIACASARDELTEAAEHDGAPDGGYILSKLERIAQQVECASRIIGDLRTFVRGSANRQPLPFDPASAVESAINLTAYGLRQAGMKLSKSLGGDLPPVIGEPGRLEQVLVNLLNNARDAGGRTIHISSGVINRNERAFIQIVVEDDGAGIPADVLPYLFVAFITTKARDKGTGLGLRICRRIVEEMEGEISASNRTNGGARFEILLPAAPSESYRGGMASPAGFEPALPP